MIQALFHRFLAFLRSTVGSVAAVSVFWCVWKMLRKLRTYRNLIVHDSKPLSVRLAAHPKLSAVIKSFAPSIRNPHLQIALTVALPRLEAVLLKSKVKFFRQAVTMSDGGQVVLDWAHAPSEDGPPARPSSILLVFPGLTGTSSDYIQLCLQAVEEGHTPVVFHKRGHAAGADVTLGTPRKLQGFGEVHDVEQVLEHTLLPACPVVYAVGYSAGSGLLASFVGTAKNKDALAGAAFVSAGFDALALFMEGRINPWYDSIMTMSLKQLMKRHQSDLESHGIRAEDVAAAKTVAEMDSAVYRVLGKHNNLEEYWQHNNPMRGWHTVQVPCLCLNALDDPICTADNIPVSKFAEQTAPCPSMMLVRTQYGSHTAFFGSSTGERRGLQWPRRWDSDVVLRYFEALADVRNDP